MHATEGVWGLACDPWDPAAVSRLLDLKGRAAAKGLIVIGHDLAAFEPELAALPAAERAAVADSWPGAVTWILPNRQFPAWITGDRMTVAARVPGHPQARALVEAHGAPLVSTSANPSGFAPPRNRFQARARFETLRRGARLHRRHVGFYFLPGETAGRRGPSEIRTVSGAVLRGGG